MSSPCIVSPLKIQVSSIVPICSSLNHRMANHLRSHHISIDRGFSRLLHCIAIPIKSRVDFPMEYPPRTKSDYPHGKSPKNRSCSAICWNPMFQVKLFLQKPSSTQESNAWYPSVIISVAEQKQPERNDGKTAFSPYFPPGRLSHFFVPFQLHDHTWI